MNKKIKKLVKQAGTDTSGKWISVDNAEKVAELILRDCIDHIKTWEKDSRNHISYMLKNHYGFDE